MIMKIQRFQLTSSTLQDKSRLVQVSYRPKNSGLTKKELKKQCYHDKDCMHHRTPISFLKGKINY